MGGEISCEWWAIIWLDKIGYLRVGCVVFCMLILRRWRLCMVSACRLHCVVRFYVNVAFVCLCCGVTVLSLCWVSFVTPIAKPSFWKGHNLIPKPENDDTTHTKSSRTPHEHSANSENNNKRNPAQRQNSDTTTETNKYHVHIAYHTVKPTCRDHT
jgi:hypothetical protein